jgi:type IV pilus assembly protein PilQ
MTIATLFFTTFLASAQVITLDARDMDLSEFFRLVANLTNMNVVLHPAVQGQVNLMLKDASLQDVVDLVMKNHGLGKEIQGNTMRIAPLASFEAEQRQVAATEAARLNARPLQTRIYFLNYARAEDIALIVSRLISPRGSVIAYMPRNAVIVRDVEPEPAR